MASGEYSLFRPLFLISKGQPEGEVKTFIDWLQSEEGQQVVSEQGTVNLKEGANIVKKFKHWEHKELVWNYAK